MWTKILTFFKGILGDIVAFLNPLAKEIEANGGKFLLETALNAVIAAEKTGGSGTDKFNAAKATVLTALAAQGIPIVLNAVHGALEAAVAQIRAGA